MPTGSHSRCLMVNGPYGCCMRPADAAEPAHVTNFYFEDGEPVSMECSSTACGPLDALGQGPLRCGGGVERRPYHSEECGTYMLGDVEDCSALGEGPAGEVFACGDSGLSCEKGMYYCRDGSYCVPLPAACADAAASCACYESVYGPPVLATGGWQCTDLGPGTFSIRSID